MNEIQGFFLVRPARIVTPPQPQMDRSIIGPLHCHGNVLLSVRGDKYARDNGDVDAHSIYASVIAFDDVDDYVALRRDG